MQILQEQKSALPPTPVNRATVPPSNSCLSYFMLVPKDQAPAAAGSNRRNQHRIRLIKKMLKAVQLNQTNLSLVLHGKNIP